MRRIALLLGLTLTLPACQTAGQFVGDPTAGFGGFFTDTHTISRDANSPAGDSDNMRRARGEEPDVTPLLPEAGNVWPPPQKPDPSLEDLLQQQNQEPGTPPATPRGSSTPPPALTVSPPPLNLAPVPSPATGTQGAPAPTVPSGTVVTPQGPASITTGANGQATYTLPNGTSGRAIPNGNGTITLIGPDGSVQSVPAPR